MLNKFKKQMKNEKGLTLIELLAVVVILAIIAAIAIPAIGNIITNSKVNALKADGNNILSAANLYFIENSAETSVDTDKLSKGGFLEDSGGFPIDTTVTIAKKDGGNQLSGTAKSKGDKPSILFTNATNANITAAGVGKEGESNTGLTITRD